MRYSNFIYNLNEFIKNINIDIVYENGIIFSLY